LLRNALRCLNLKSWASREKVCASRTRATRMCAAVAKRSVQVDPLSNSPVKVERLLTGRLLHRKREVTLHINSSFERISRSLGGKLSVQDPTPLALHYHYRDG
jgi:hypothetical protein